MLVWLTKIMHLYLGVKKCNYFAYCILDCTGEIQTFSTGTGENYRQLSDETGW